MRKAARKRKIKSGYYFWLRVATKRKSWPFSWPATFRKKVASLELWSVVVQHQLVAADVKRVDELQVKHSTLFDKVPEYNGLKRPKHHFLTHLAQDVWRFGPPRGYWCFGFEAFNKVIKAGSERTNWKNESLGIMRYW